MSYIHGPLPDFDFVPEVCVSFLLGELFLTSVQCNNGNAKSNAESHLQMMMMMMMMMMIMMIMMKKKK